MSRGVIPELLQRAARFFRTGQHAFGATSWQAFVAHADRRDDAGMTDVLDGLERQDYLRVADVIEHVIAPLYRA